MMSPPQAWSVEPTLSLDETGAYPLQEKSPAYRLVPLRFAHHVGRNHSIGARRFSARRVLPVFIWRSKKLSALNAVQVNHQPVTNSLLFSIYKQLLVNVFMTSLFYRRLLILHHKTLDHELLHRPISRSQVCSPSKAASTPSLTTKVGCDFRHRRADGPTHVQRGFASQGTPRRTQQRRRREKLRGLRPRIGHGPEAARDQGGRHKVLQPRHNFHFCELSITSVIKQFP